MMASQDKDDDDTKSATMRNTSTHFHKTTPSLSSSPSSNEPTIYRTLDQGAGVVAAPPPPPPPLPPPVLTSPRIYVDDFDPPPGKTEKREKEGGLLTNDDEDDEDDGFVRIEPEMHRGHVEVKVMREGWLKRQCLRVVNGQPSIWRHFAMWKKVIKEIVAVL